MLRQLLLPLALFFVSQAPLFAGEDRMLRVQIQPGRDLWVTKDTPLRLTFSGIDADNLAWVKPGSLRIRLDGLDLTDLFFAVAKKGKVYQGPFGRSLVLETAVPWSYGKHVVEVRYETLPGGGPKFRQSFMVYDPDAVLKSLGYPSRKKIGKVAAPLFVQQPPRFVGAAPLHLSPADKDFVHKGRSDLVVAWRVKGAGMQLKTLKILLDGRDVTSNFSRNADRALWANVPLADGKHTIVGQAVDHEGRLRVDSATFIVFDGSKRKPWFFAPTNRPHPLAHTHHQFQWYGGGLSSAYFHHGVDIREPYGSSVYASEGGKITSFYWYNRKPYYFEIGITDAAGFVWQYHHVDRNKVPASIVQIAARRGSIARGTKIGANVYWPVRAYGALFHHIHLNVLGPDGRYLNPLNFMLPINDTRAPVVHRVYVTQNGSSKVLNPGGGNGAVVSGKLDFVARAEDFVGTQPYQLTVKKMTWQLTELGGSRTHNVPETMLWDFDFLPGGANRNAFVWDIFRYRTYDGFRTYSTSGNYSRREFYYCLTNRIGGYAVNESKGYFNSAERDLNNRLKFPNGTYRLTVRAYDIKGNVGSRSITLTLRN